MNLLVIWMACYGITFLVCDAKLAVAANLRRHITDRSPFFSEMLNCYFCTGFWVSLFVHVVLAVFPSNWPDYVVSLGLNAFAGATFCYALNSLILTLESYHDRNNPQE